MCSNTPGRPRSLLQYFSQTNPVFERINQGDVVATKTVDSGGMSPATACTCHRWRRDPDRSDANYRLLLKEAPQRTSLLPDGVPAAPALSQPDGFNRREIRKSPTYWLMSRLCSGVPTAEQPRDRRRWRFRLSGWRCSRAEPQQSFPGSLICPHLSRALFALAASGIALLATMAAAVPVGRLGPYRFGAEGKTG